MSLSTELLKSSGLQKTSTPIGSGNSLSSQLLQQVQTKTYTPPKITVQPTKKVASTTPLIQNKPVTPTIPLPTTLKPGQKLKPAIAPVDFTTGKDPQTQKMVSQKVKPIKAITIGDKTVKGSTIGMPEKSNFWTDVKNIAYQITNPTDIIKDQVTYSLQGAIAKKSGVDREQIPLEYVQKNRSAITAELGIRNEPTTKEVVSAVFNLAIIGGLMETPVPTLIGLAGFTGIGELTNIGVSAIKKEKYQPMAGKGLSDLLPADTSETIVAGVDILQFALQAKAFKTLQSKSPKIANILTKDIKVKYNIPENISISKEVMGDYYTGRKSVDPNITQAIKDLNLSKEDIRNSVRQGMDLEVPWQKIVTITDKPYWAKIKSIFKIPVTPESKTITNLEKPKTKTFTAGLLDSGGIKKDTVVLPKKEISNNNIQKLISEYQSDQGVTISPDKKVNISPALSELTKLSETPEVIKDTQDKVATLPKDEEGKITLYRVGTVREGDNRLISASYDKKASEDFLETHKEAFGDRPITEIKVNPEDIKVFIGGTEKEVLIKQQGVQPTGGGGGILIFNNLDKGDLVTYGKDVAEIGGSLQKPTDMVGVLAQAHKSQGIRAISRWELGVINNDLYKSPYTTEQISGFLDNPKNTPVGDISKYPEEIKVLKNTLSDFYNQTTGGVGGGGMIPKELDSRAQEVKPQKAIPTEKIHQKIIPKRPQLPILGDLMIKNGKAVSTDLEIWVETPTDKPDGAYQFIGNDLILRPSISVDDFPVMPTAKNKVAEVLAETLSQIMVDMTPSTVIDETRPVLQAVNLVFYDTIGVTAVTTDGYRLFKKNYPLKNEVKNGTSFLVSSPGKLVKALPVLSDKVSINSEKEFMVFSDANDNKVGMRLVGGTFPDFEKVLPKEIKGVWTLNSKELTQAMKDLASYAKEMSNIVKFTPSEGKMKIEAGTKETYKSVSIEMKKSEFSGIGELPSEMGLIMPVRFNESQVELGKDILGFNYRFIVDMLKQVGSAEIDLGYQLKDGKLNQEGPVVFVKAGTIKPTELKPEKAGEALKEEAPAYKGGAEGAAVGKFANLENVTRQRNERPDLPSFKQVAFPEIVRIVKALTGKVPKINKRLFAFGRTRPETLEIEMKPSVFDDPVEAAKTLTHELGHITDYLPESAQRTGNLLGRIASLKGYFKHWLSEFPGGLGKMLTDKEKRQLRKEAEELAKKPVTEEKEIVVSEKVPTPEEILDIWRTNTSSINTSELLSYIQKLPDELKKDIVKAALKSTVPKWVTFTNKIKEKITVGVIRSAPEDIRRLYKELIHKEILKRRLIELKTVRQELMALSATWRPFDRMKSSDHYVKYRDKPSELYADAISVLYNDPERLKMQAPEFYRGFFNYLDQKPEVAEQYYQIQHLLNRGSDEVNKVRIEDIYKGFEEGAKKRKEAFNEKIDKKSFLFKGVTQHITKFYPIYHELDKAIKEGKIDFSRKQVIRETLEEMAYKRNDVWLDLERNETEVMQPLKKAGISERELGAWFMLERNLGDRLGIANPGGLIGEFNEEVKNFLAKNFMPEQSEILKKAVTDFHKATFEIAEKMYQQGMIKEKVWKERIEPYKESYVTYGVVKYIDKNYVTPYVKEMIGTLEQIENPLVTTMYKRGAMLQALLSHKAKTEFVSFLKEVAPDEIPESKSIMGIKHQRIYQKAPGKGQLVLQEKGDWVSYDIDPYFEQMFKQFDPKDLHSLAFLAGQFNRYFKPVVTTYKLGWAVYNNPLRDIQRTMKNLAAISKLEGIPFNRVSFLADWVSSIPKGFKFANGRLTPLAKEAIGAHAISTPWVSYDPTAGEDKALYTLYQKYRFGLEGEPATNKRITQKFLLLVEIVLKALEITGGTFESTTKLAGFKYLAKRMADQGKAGFYTRNYLGTPNYLEGGSMKEIDNNLWVFSNVILQGYRSDIELLRNPKSRGAWIFESFLQSGIWKLLMIIAASGFLGKTLKDAYDNMTEYHKSNFLAFPLVTLSSGRTLYWTIPQDETNRLAGAITWKTGMALQKKLTKPQQVLDIGAGLAPGMTPIFDVIGAWVDYTRGINPWDSYYGRNVLDQQTAQIRGTEGIKKMALWSLNEVGLGNFATYDPSTKTTFEKFIQYTPLINRMFKVSDYGQIETEIEAEKKELQQRAIQNKKEADLVKNSVDSYLKNGGNPEDYKDLIETKLYPDGPETSDDKANLTRVKKDFDQKILAREGYTKIKTIMKLRLSTSKINALKGFAQEMEPDKYNELLNKLLDAKVISEDVYDKALE